MHLGTLGEKTFHLGTSIQPKADFIAFFLLIKADFIMAWHAVKCAPWLSATECCTMQYLQHCKFQMAVLCAAHMECTMCLKKI